MDKVGALYRLSRLIGFNEAFQLFVSEAASNRDLTYLLFYYLPQITLGCGSLSYLIPSSTILNPISIENILDIWDRVGSRHGWHDYFSRSSGISFIY